MSQGRPTPDSLHGQQLLNALRQGWTPLPMRTLLAMAVGGLQVRMMRSTVTMLSIVLAIAFLTYSGLTARLTYRLAIAARALEDVTTAPASTLESAARQATPRVAPVVGAADEAALRRLAARLGMARIKELTITLPVLKQAVRRAQLDRDEAVKRQRAVAADPNAVAGDQREAARRLQSAERDLAQAQRVLTESEQTIALGQWIGRGGADPQMVTLLRERLTKRVTELVEGCARPARLSDEDLEQADMALDLLDLPADDAIRTALVQEHQKRNANELKNRLRQAGVNMETTLAGDPMDAWLIMMAMLTCAVGIANAMLMSVTERIREIGTMKCLGAQDNLVVKLFLLESAVLGMVGAGLGIVLGVAVALAGAVLQFGGFGVQQFPVLAAIPIIALSVLGGMVLSVVGATYPAFAASRMRPVDALRVDE